MTVGVSVRATATATIRSGPRVRRTGTVSTEGAPGRLIARKSTAWPSWASISRSTRSACGRLAHRLDRRPDPRARHVFRVASSLQGRHEQGFAVMSQQCDPVVVRALPNDLDVAALRPMADDAQGIAVVVRERNPDALRSAAGPVSSGRPRPGGRPRTVWSIARSPPDRPALAARSCRSVLGRP